jgi:DNA-binding NarL/FixJ family response regulator
MKKILIVDDDVALRTVLTRMLERQGYAVYSAHSGVEGLAMFEQHQPDLIVSDVLMPYMDGLEFCRRLRKLPSGQLVPFLFLSNRVDVDDRIQGHQMGADDYLVKPFEVAELVAKIEAQLARSQRIQAELLRQRSVPAALPAALPSVMPSLMPSVMSSLFSPRTPHLDLSGELPFTPAENKVFVEVVQGYTNKQIGDRLFISPRTVQTHISSILNKLGLETRAQMIRYAFDHGYRPPVVLPDRVADELESDATVEV